MLTSPLNNILAKFLLVAFILSGCSAAPHLYTVVTAEGYSEKLQTKPFNKYIIVDESYSTELQIGLIAMQLGYKRETNKALDSISDLSEQNFLKGMLNLNNREYEVAVIYFKEAAEKGIFQARILEVACEVQLGTALDYLKIYQSLYDQAPNDLYRKLITGHYQMYRYGLY